MTLLLPPPLAPLTIPFQRLLETCGQASVLNFCYPSQIAKQWTVHRGCTCGVGKEGSVKKRVQIRIGVVRN